jgi:hypothetical protein
MLIQTNYSQLIAKYDARGLEITTLKSRLEMIETEKLMLQFEELFMKESTLEGGGDTSGKKEMRRKEAMAEAEEEKEEITIFKSRASRRIYLLTRDIVRSCVNSLFLALRNGLLVK